VMKTFKDQIRECKANGTLFEAKIPTSGKIALACAKYKCHCNSKVCKDDSHTAPRKCTKNNPYTVDKNNSLSRWIHVDANEVHDSQESHQYGGDTIRLKCPHCGIEWTEELPQ